MAGTADRRFHRGYFDFGEIPAPCTWQGFRGTISDMSASEHTLLCSCEHLYNIEENDGENNPAMTDEKMKPAG